MKIQLQSTTFYPAFGGIENHLYYISKTLLKIGHEPTILCSRHQLNLPVKEVYEGIKIMRYPYYRLPSIPFVIFSPVYRAKKLQFFLKTHFKNFNTIWSGHPYSTYASCKALPEIPVIYLQASVWPFILRYGYKRLNNIKKIALKVQNLQNYYIEKKAMEMCRKIVVLSKIRMKEISDFYNFPKDKFEVIPPGVDLERFKPRVKDKSLLNELKLGKKDKIVLGVCRLSRVKNISMLIKAFAKINLKHAYLLIVGDGSEKFYLERLTKQLNITNKVKFLGFRKDVERFYSIADLFVLPSIYEGFGLVYLEAMASGVPCIGLRSNYPNVIVASEEIIRDGQTGYCIDPYSVENLTEKIEEIISNNKLRYQMGQKAREICEKKYLWEKHVGTLVKLTEKIIKK